MANPKNRQLVEGALNAELARDRTKTYVVEISPLGLVEMTRQNVTDGPREILTDKCPTCDATGVVVSAESRAVEVERKVREHVARSKAEAFLVELHSDVAAILSGPGGERLAELEKETGKRFAFKTKKSFRLDRFAILAEGKAGQIEGLEPSTGPDGKEAATPRPRSRKAAPEAVVALDAALLEGDGEAPVAVPEPSADGDEPAEKPKKKTRRGSRGGRGRKKKAAVAADGAAPDGEEAKPVEPVEAAAEVEAPSANGDAPAEEKPKKKTRRGTRGGRRRKKKPAPEEAAESIATGEDAG
jgi:ribonuclease G